MEMYVFALEISYLMFSYIRHAITFLSAFLEHYDEFAFLYYAHLMSYLFC